MKDDKKNKENDKDVKFSTLAYSLLLIAGLFLFTTGIMIYKIGVNNRFTQAIVKIIPFPAAIINSTDFIYLRTLQTDLAAVKRFYENQDFSNIGFRVDFKTADGQKRLKIKEKNRLNKLIENEIIKQLAEKRNIKISSAIVKQEIARKLSEYGSQDAFSDNLKNLYGWNISDFEEKIVKPDMYREQLQKNVQESDREMSLAKKKIEEARKELENKKVFSDVAINFSDGESAKNGGELGWLSNDQMIPEIAVAAVLLNTGERSEVIESSLGFHIIRIDDKKNEDGIDKAKLSQIFVKRKNFSDWLFEQEKGFNIYIPMKSFFWDKETQSVKFVDQNLRDFESNLEKNSPDDISVLF